MGKRMLRASILAPGLDGQTLHARYDVVEQLKMTDPALKSSQNVGRHSRPGAAVARISLDSVDRVICLPWQPLAALNAC